MTVKERIGNVASTALLWIVILLFLPLMLLAFLGYLLYWPIAHIKIKRSRYHKDFPRKITFACGLHPDNEVYTIVKENDLPVEYIKQDEEYYLPGYFVCGDTLLNFTEPFFYDEKKKVWLFWPGEEEKEPMEIDENEDEDNTDDCVAIDVAKELMLQQFAADVPGRECRRVAVFYERQKTERQYGAAEVEALQSAGCVVYERGELAQAIRSAIGE